MTNKVIETWIRFAPANHDGTGKYVIQKFKGKVQPPTAKRRAERLVLPVYPDVAIRDVLWLGDNGGVEYVWKAPEPEKEKSP